MTADVVMRVRQGQTAAAVLQLLNPDGTPHDLTGAPQLALVLAANDGQGQGRTFSTGDTPPKLTVQDAPAGKVAFVPDALLTEESPYRGYLRRYYTASSWEPWPGDGDLVVEVLPSYA